ncbi:hypothetical protein [Mordavella massiliensis]|uniref:Uncharacterized protein n=1 Tax=Mordavella massiliensis TaxID=1871024 RepID=A0A938XBL4_9CLOT|nr:hypothetical protein [Mordavella massiliensis]MBM6947719.1 hypothetical protein [Mordavella massiliensis]
MKKRGIFSVLLAIMLMLTVIPAKVSNADGGYEASSWEEWLQMREQGIWPSIDATDGFQWPEEGCTLVVDRELRFSGDWVIPSNVTVIVKVPVRPGGVILPSTEIRPSSLTIYGTWQHSGNQAKIQETYSEQYTDHVILTVGDGGKFIIDSDTDHQQFENMTVKSGGTLEINRYESYAFGQDNVLTLEPGANVTGTGSLRLDGEICGAGAEVSIPVVVQGGYMSGETNAVLSGDLTVSQIWQHDSTLTIPAGSSVTCDDLRMAPYQAADTAVLSVEGDLAVNDGIDFAGPGQKNINISGCLSVDGYTSLREGTASINLTDTGVLDVHKTLDFLSANGKITGTGTIKVYGTMEGDVLHLDSMITVDDEYPWIDDMKTEAVAKGYMDDTITIWKSWDCDHQWVKGETTTPTCSSEGYTTYTCSICGSTKQDDFTDKLPHTPDANTDCTKDTLCIVCGEVVRPAGEHTYDEGTVKTDATCTEPGVMKYTCKACGTVKEEEIPAKGHQWISETEENQLTYTCSVCKEEHSFQLEADSSVSLSLGAKAVESLAAQAEAEGYEDLRIQAEVIGESSLTEQQSEALKALTDDALLIRVTLEAVSVDAAGNEEVTVLHELGGEAQISAEYDAGDLQEGQAVKVAYIAKDGTTEDMKAVYGNGEVTFVTTHFSDYAAYVEETEIEDPSDPEDQQKPSGGDSGDKTGTDKKDGKYNETESGVPKTGDEAAALLWPFCMAAAFACGAGVILKRKMK